MEWRTRWDSNPAMDHVSKIAQIGRLQTNRVHSELVFGAASGTRSVGAARIGLKIEGSYLRGIRTRLAQLSLWSLIPLDWNAIRSNAWAGRGARYLLSLASFRNYSSYSK
jgi:hypothetical protein